MWIIQHFGVDDVLVLSSCCYYLWLLDNGGYPLVLLYCSPPFHVSQTSSAKLEIMALKPTIVHQSQVPLSDFAAGSITKNPGCIF